MRGVSALDAPILREDLRRLDVVAIEVRLVAEDPTEQGRVGCHGHVGGIHHAPHVLRLTLRQVLSRAIRAPVAHEGVDAEPLLVCDARRALEPLHHGQEGFAVDQELAVWADVHRGGLRRWDEAEERAAQQGSDCQDATHGDLRGCGRSP